MALAAVTGDAPIGGYIPACARRAHYAGWRQRGRSSLAQPRRGARRAGRCGAGAMDAAGNARPSNHRAVTRGGEHLCGNVEPSGRLQGTPALYAATAAPTSARTQGRRGAASPFSSSASSGTTTSSAARPEFVPAGVAIAAEMKRAYLVSKSDPEGIWVRVGDITEAGIAISSAWRTKQLLLFEKLADRQSASMSVSPMRRSA